MNLQTTEIFVWTEAFNCGELLDPFLSSYLMHNSHPIHIYGFAQDLNQITIKNPLIKAIDLSEVKFKSKSIEGMIKCGYREGHLGTAILWAFLIKTRKEKYFIHLDADTIFLDEVISDFEGAIVQEFDLIGSRRRYKKRGYRNTGFDGFLLDRRPDAINTDCFCFNPSKINKVPFNWLVRKIRGRRSSILPVVDFFDPITFELLNKKAKIKYFEADSADSSGVVETQFMGKRISFAAVGSGINFYKNPEVITSVGYRDFALASYSLYSKYVLGKTLPLTQLNAPDLIKKLEKLDKEIWRIV